MKSKILSASFILLLLFQYSIPAKTCLSPISTYPLLLFQQGTETKIETNKNENQSGISKKKKIIKYSIFLGVPVIIYSIAFASWDWGSSSGWIWAHEGWFGKNTPSGGLDKVSHLYGHYLGMRASYTLFNYTENGGQMKWFYSIFLASSIGLAIEIGDAYAKPFGFSFEDLAADFIGIGLGIILEKFPVIDSFISLSAEYFPTKYFRENPKWFWLFPLDYTGWKYMINIKLSGFQNIGLDTPEFIRYVMIDIGYYTRGYTKYDDRYINLNRRRFWYIGISVNMIEVIKDLFTDKNSFASRAGQQIFKYYHLPAGINFEDKL